MGPRTLLGEDVRIARRDVAAALLARIVRLREAIEDGEAGLALDLVCDLERDLGEACKTEQAA